jgi:hypothetical protein
VVVAVAGDQRLERPQLAKATFVPTGSQTQTCSAAFVGGAETNNTALAIQVHWRLLSGGAPDTLKNGRVVMLPGTNHCGIKGSRTTASTWSAIDPCTRSQTQCGFLARADVSNHTFAVRKR